MSDSPARSRRWAAFVLLASPCLAGTARAELPASDDVKVRYFVTDESGEHVRPMTEVDHLHFMNRARCQCGQQVGVEVRLAPPPADTTRRLEAFIGLACATAENAPDGQFRPCGRLLNALVPTFVQGVVGSFHPLFLVAGPDPSGPREIGDPALSFLSSCDAPAEGRSGLWMCMPEENATAGCQFDEFFYGSGDAPAAKPSTPALQFDFLPPLLPVSRFSAEPGNGAVELRWDVASSGDIWGYRVLCEEATGTAATGHDFDPPDLAAIPAGTHYFTAGNLCGDQPFSTVEHGTPAVTDPNTCGNGVVEAGEACDDGHDNRDDGLCDEGCKLRVSPELHALDWSRVCTEHLPFATEAVVVGGLDNGKTYNFVLVPYDRAGNPRAHAEVVTATPDASLPDLSADGAAEGCACTTSSEGHGLLAMSLGTLVLLALRRRRA